MDLMIKYKVMFIDATRYRRNESTPLLYFFSLQTLFSPQAGGGFPGSLLRCMASVASGAALWSRVLQAA